jgi:hypothetical protein
MVGELNSPPQYQEPTTAVSSDLAHDQCKIRETKKEESEMTARSSPQPETKIPKAKR